MTFTLGVFPSQFGGRLVTFGLPSTPAHQVPQPCPRLVFISQVTTELEFLTRSVELQEALGSGKLLDYCQNKSHQASLQDEKMLWQFLKVGPLMAGCLETAPVSPRQPLSAPDSPCQLQCCDTGHCPLLHLYTCSLNAVCSLYWRLRGHWCRVLGRRDHREVFFVAAIADVLDTLAEPV